MGPSAWPLYLNTELCALPLNARWDCTGPRLQNDASLWWMDGSAAHQSHRQVSCSIYPHGEERFLPHAASWIFASWLRDAMSGSKTAHMCTGDWARVLTFSLPCGVDTTYSWLIHTLVLHSKVTQSSACSCFSCGRTDVSLTFPDKDSRQDGERLFPAWDSGESLPGTETRWTNGIRQAAYVSFCKCLAVFTEWIILGMGYPLPIMDRLLTV